MKMLSTEQVKRILDEPNGPEKLMQDAPAAFDAAWALFVSGDAGAAAFLCRCAKRKEFALRMTELLKPERGALYAALSSDSPKLRRNAARLSGTLGDASDAKALIAALEKEDTRFVRPSILLALGALGGEDAKAELSDYTVQPAADAGEEKHVREETTALTTARASFITLQKHEFTGLGEACDILLRSPDLLGDALAYELGLMHITPKKVLNGGVIVETDDILSLYGARSFTEALIVLARGCLMNPKAIAIAVKERMIALLQKSHAGSSPFGYRIELRAGAEMQRGTFARELASLLSGEQLVNSTGDYEAELRVEQRSNGADVYLKLYTYNDERFAYRVGALPASMHPATAAAIVRHARDFLKADARVLDPCCGSGTFLIERERFLQRPCANLTGVDIAHHAIDIARENALAAESRAKFIVNDCLRFAADRPYDELIANLPFGNRVGSHEDNTRLYAGILDNLPRWLKPGGVAILYTMEFTLLKKLIRERPALSLSTEARTGAGGLTPGIFIVRV